MDEGTVPQKSAKSARQRLRIQTPRGTKWWHRTHLPPFTPYPGRATPVARPLSAEPKTFIAELKLKIRRAKAKTRLVTELGCWPHFRM